MQDLTTGPITRHLLKTTGFMLVTMLFQTLYFLIDLYWVGRLGTAAVAAVGIAGNLTFIVLALTQMLGVGTTAVISHAVGQKDAPQAVMLFKQAQVLAMLTGVLFLVIGLATRLPSARGMAADARTAELATQYLAWFVPAMALQFGLVAMSAALRAIGNFKTGMVVGTATVILNMLLAPFLIFGWGTGRPLGVAGAALSSLVAIVVGLVWLTAFFRKVGFFLRFDPRAWRPRTAVWKRMLGIGLPSGVEFGITTVYLALVYSITRPFGAAAQAGFGIGMRIIQAGFMPVVALAFSVAPVAGQNFGARLAQRVKDTFKDAAWLAAALKVAGEREHHPEGRRHPRGIPERVLHALGQARAEVLAGHRSDGERQRDHGHEPRLDDAHADAESRLRRGAEGPGDRIDEREIHRRDAELHAARQPNAEHLLPDGGSRPPGARVEAQEGADLAEVRREPYEPHNDGDERGYGRAGDAERMAGAPAEDEERREDHVEDDRHGSHHHAGLEVADGAQGGTHRHQAELQRHGRDEPGEVLHRELGGARVRGHAAGVGEARHQADYQEQDARHDRQHLRLVEEHDR